jgi:two-component system chemotaxis response regulator CheB
MGTAIQVLVVDDSLYTQKRIVEILESDGGIKVAGLARDGMEAIDGVNRLKPDVVTMDIHMPRMDGITAVAQIMETCPRPIVILSSYSKLHGQTCMRALELGAVDIVEKPTGSVSLDLATVRDELLQKVRIAARIKVVRNAGSSSTRPATAMPDRSRLPLPDAAPPERSPSRDVAIDTAGIVCIGSSTGGPCVLGKILSCLPRDFPLPIAIAQHMPGKFMSSFVGQLATKSSLPVREPLDGEAPAPGTVYVAPGFHHLEINSARRFVLLDSNAVTGPIPSINTLFRSAAAHYGSLAVGVILTGMGDDGASGLLEIRKRGGATLGQDEESCAVFGMPKAAFEAGSVARLFSADRIAFAIQTHAPTACTGKDMS